MSMETNAQPGYSYRMPMQRANNTRVLWGIGLGMCLLFLAGAAFVAVNAYGILSAKSEGQQVFDQFMHATAIGDYATASALYAPDFPKDKIANLQDGNPRLVHYVTFIPDKQFFFNGSDDSNQTVAFSGRMDYGSWGMGTFGIHLRKIGDHWYIYDLNLDSTSPPGTKVNNSQP